MDDKYTLLQHYLAALAYRTQKALRGAPDRFGSFRAAEGVRTPHQLIWHMDSVLGYARTYFIGGEYRQSPLPDFQSEIARFHGTLEDLGRHLQQGTPMPGTTPENMLQGPFADAMTHAGQLAMLRRLAGSPIPPENFIVADVRAGNLGPNQPEPISPDKEWKTAEEEEERK